MQMWIARNVLSQGRLALAIYRCAHRFSRRHWIVPARCLMLLGRFLTGIEINSGARVGRNLRIKHGMGLVIGGGVTIGDDCAVFHGVTIGQSGTVRGMPVIGDRVVIYAGAVVAGRITVGDDAVIGANAVVLRDVPAGATVVGNPARPLRENEDTRVPTAG